MGVLRRAVSFMGQAGWHGENREKPLQCTEEDPFYVGLSVTLHRNKGQHSPTSQELFCIVVHGGQVVGILGGKHEGLLNH
jgi:hypothetical protein